MSEESLFNSIQSRAPTGGIAEAHKMSGSKRNKPREVAVRILILVCLFFAASLVRAEEPTDLFNRGEGISLDGVIPANERSIISLVADDRGRIFGGTTGRAAHFFVHDPTTQK